MLVRGATFEKFLTDHLPQVADEGCLSMTLFSHTYNTHNTL